MKLSRVGTSLAMTAIAALTLAGCAGGGTPAATDGAATDGAASTDGASAGGSLSGTLEATGASSMEKAQVNGWVPGFQAVQPDVVVNYTATGSGTGRENFLAGQSHFIGSDRAYKLDEIEAGGFSLCADGTPLVEFPAYISPIAIAYNLPGVESLKLDATVIANIFAGKITTWNDPAIAALNEGVDLPSSNITAVHRGDKSGTTGNFLSYLEEAAPEAWTYGTDDTFPAELGGESADKTAGVAAAIEGGENTIGYLDASAASNLQVAEIKSGNDFVAYTPEAAAAVVGGSPLEEGREATDVVYALDYTGVEGAYPIVLVSYLIGCSEYKDAATGELVKAYFEYVVSEEGQAAAVEAAQSAPISDDVRSAALDAIATIK